MSELPPYLSSPEAVLSALATRPSGLSTNEARRRLRQSGPNELKAERKPRAIARLAAQFADVMVLVLIGAAAISLLVGEWLDAVTIMAIVMLNAWLGFFQEHRVERSLAALKKLSAPRARVLRDGSARAIPAAEVAPGDVLVLEAGDRVPADALLLEAHSLEVNEAALTGESLAVRKRPGVMTASDDTAEREPPATRVPVGDRWNMVHAGTVITRGRGRAVVTATGMATEVGRIAHLMLSADEGPTPLQMRLAELGQLLVTACLAISGLVVLVGVLRGEPIYEMFLAGISLAVAAIPEGLPATVTVVLALGVQRMMRQKAIVRRLPAVETLGCATVICTDKTGTLTRNEMVVRAVVTAGGGSATARAHLAAALCNNARPVGPLRQARPSPRSRGGAQTSASPENPGGLEGDPTEVALMASALDSGLRLEELERLWPRRHEIPFESERRMMTVVAGSPPVAFVKGAPDTVLARASRLRQGGRSVALTDALRARWLAEVEALAQGAMRVIAVAERRMEALEGEPRPEEVERDLTFLGLFGLSDPLRAGAPRAVARCRQAGIRVVMVTGDHPATARAVAEEIGLGVSGEAVITGRQIDDLDDAALAEAMGRVEVCARVSPEHKLRIVRALRARGEIVAMTGDGVNDAPALKEADIGVSMGIQGTDVAREASHMVLADDNFNTIVAAVEAGRTIYDNIRKFLRYLLSCNTGEVLTMLGGALFGLPLPLIPVQILMVNLVTDGLPAMALGLDPPDGDVMTRPPRPPGESVFARRLGVKVVGRGVLIGLATLAVFTLALGQDAGNLARARTMAFATLALAQLIHAFDCRSERRSIFELPLLHNPFLMAAVATSLAVLLLTIYLPVWGRAFETVPLGWADLLLVFGAAAVGEIGVSLRRLVLVRGLRPLRRNTAV